MEEAGAGCAWAPVASERVSFRGESDGLCCCVESCVRVGFVEGTWERLLSNAGQSHGSVNWSESVVGVVKPLLRSFRPAARASISRKVYGGIKKSGEKKKEEDMLKRMQAILK